MIERKKIKKGLLLLWSADNSYNYEYTCPAIVIEVEEDWFIVKSIYNSTKSDCISKKSVSNSKNVHYRTEMKICTLAYVHEHIKKRTKKLKDFVAQKTDELKWAKKALNECQENVEAFLKTQP